MLHWMRKRLWPDTRSAMAQQHDASRILVTIETSSSTLSRSDGKQPFAITLKATVDGKDPVTIDTFQTILGPQMPALDYQGLTFKDTESGVLAERVRIDILYEVPDFLSNMTDDVVEIPPSSRADDDPAYTVTHTFKVSPTRQPKPGDPPLSFEEELQLSISQVAGFTAGHRYEIGLGGDMSKVSWWKVGKKNKVFAGDRQLTSHPDRDVPAMQMVATNTPSFVVVE